MTTKHTNGKWYAYEPQRDTGEIVITRDNPYNTRICKVLPVSPNEADTIANARLIAASPMLLEALEELTQLVQSHIPDEQENWTRNATAALKAAKGE